MNQNINTMEGCRYKITLKFTGQEDLGDYSIYGSSCHLGCSRHHSDFEILEKNADSCIMAIPALKAGTHLYQVFIKRNSTNQEFLILDGKIEVKNRCGDDAEAINSTSSEVEITFNSEEINIDVTINEGTKGEKGEKGERGEKGEDGIDGKDGVDGKDGEDGKDGQDGTIDLSFLGNNVVERTNGRAADNQTIYGCGWKFTKTGYVDMVQLQAPQLEEGESIFAKVWDSSTKSLLSKSKNSLNKGSREPFYLEPFAVNKGQEVKITFHKVEDGSTSLKTGIAVNMRISFIAEGESGGIIDDTGNYTDTTKTATIRWNFFENKFSSKEEMIAHAASDSHLNEEQKTLLEQVANGEIGGGSGASIDWFINDAADKTLPVVAETAANKGNIIIGYSSSANHDNWYGSTKQVVIGNNTSSTGWNMLTIGSGATSQKTNVTLIGNDGKGEGSGSTGVGWQVRALGDYSVSIGNTAYTYDSYGVSIGYNADANYGSVSVGTYAYSSSEGVAIGNGANSDSNGVAIGSGAQAGWCGIAIGNGAYSVNEITLKTYDTEVKFYPDGIYINGELYGGGGSGGSGGSNHKQEMLYKIKYAHTDLYQVRESQSPEWREVYDEYGNYQSGYDHYPYYDDITASGEWLYDLKTQGLRYPGSNSMQNKVCGVSNNIFRFCPIIKKFIAKIGNWYPTSLSKLFYECQNLEEVILHVEFLVSARNLFIYCPKLHTFRADLSNLSSASYMFGEGNWNCTSLDLESVKFISDSIKSDCYDEIHIGIDGSLQGNSELEEALQKIRNKGWTVYEIYSENY